MNELRIREYMAYKNMKTNKSRIREKRRREKYIKANHAFMAETIKNLSQGEGEGKGDYKFEQLPPKDPSFLADMKVILKYVFNELKKKWKNRKNRSKSE